MEEVSDVVERGRRMRPLAKFEGGGGWYAKRVGVSPSYKYETVVYINKSCIHILIYIYST